MRFTYFIILPLLFSCKSDTIDLDQIEFRENGLSYVKGTNALVEGRVVRKFKNGKINELHNYKQGKPIGKWFAYDENGKVYSHGLGVDAAKFEKFIAVNLGNSFLSINTTGNFTYAAFYLDKKEIFDDIDLLLKLLKAIEEKYSNKNDFDRVLFFDKQHEYTVSFSALSNPNFTIDSVKGREKKVIFIN